jgi:hypothetical protein
VELPSIIAIIPGVERTLTLIVPPTSVRSSPSTVNSSRRSLPGASPAGQSFICSEPSPASSALMVSASPSICRLSLLAL